MITTNDRRLAAEHADRARARWRWTMEGAKPWIRVPEAVVPVPCQCRARAVPEP